MSWLSDFKSLILRGRDSFFFKYLKNISRRIYSAKYKGAGILQIILHNVIHCKGRCQENFFSQLVSKLRLMGSPWTSVFYHTTSLWVESNLECNLCCYTCFTLKLFTTMQWERKRKFEFNLCCLMTPGLSKDIQCHVWPYSFLCLQITRSDIRPHINGLSA